MRELRIQTLQGVEIATHLDALAALRIAVFREWPYLYEGTLEYESRYLEVYLRRSRSMAALVWDGGACVAATTTLPLAEAELELQQPFRAHGYPLDRIAYFGESVVLKPYRGRGLGARFFELREAHARRLGCPLCAFCAVERPPQHPARPAGYVPNDAFWRRRGYRKEPALRTELSWPDLGEARPTAKPMSFWMRELPVT